MMLPRTAPSRRRRLLTGLALGSVLLPLAACSGGDDVQAFCQQGEDATAEVEAAGALADDPQAIADSISESVDRLQEIDAPEEIAADWETLTGTFERLDEVLQETDLTDQDAFYTAIGQFGEYAESQDLETATDNISTFFTENCEA